MAASKSAEQASKLKIAIIGTGGVGGTLGKIFGTAGHQVVFGTRDPNSDKIKEYLQVTPGATAISNEKACQIADVLILSTPWDATKKVVESLAGAQLLRGKILIDATNPVGPNLTMAVPNTTSAGEEVAKWAGDGVKVVKCFNTIGRNNFEHPQFPEGVADMFYCGNDAAAKGVVKNLINEMKYNPVDVGDLTQARWTENMAMLWITLAYKCGWGPNHAFKIMKR